MPRILKMGIHCLPGQLTVTGKQGFQNGDMFFAAFRKSDGSPQIACAPANAAHVVHQVHKTAITEDG